MELTLPAVSTGLELACLRQCCNTCHHSIRPYSNGADRHANERGLQPPVFSSTLAGASASMRFEPQPPLCTVRSIATPSWRRLNRKGGYHCLAGQALLTQFCCAKPMEASLHSRARQRKLRLVPVRLGARVAAARSRGAGQDAAQVMQNFSVGGSTRMPAARAV